jgi:hypothetical protein
MKKILVVGLTMMMTLAACGGSGESTVSASAGTDAAAAGEFAAAQGELSPVAQNIIGLLKLEDTELAVDPAQAETLLPLWQAYRSLLNSDTTAPAELEALQAQINQALTDEQQDAIAAMDLSPEDMSSLMEELGVTPFGGAAGDGTRAGPGGAFPSDGGPGGAFPSDGRPAGGVAPPDGGFVPGPGTGPGFGGGGAAGDGLDPQAIATLQASRPAGRQGDRFSLVLLDPLIELLKERAGA